MLAVLLGLRPAARCLRPSGRSGSLRSFAAACGLSLRLYDDASGAPIALLGRDPARLAECEALDLRKQGPGGGEDRGALARAIGRLLGYPPCCVAAFDERHNARFPLSVLERSGPGPYPAACNFLFSFQSRSYGASRQLERLWRSGYAANDVFLLPWIPCRFDCPRSAAFGATLLEALAAFDAEYAGALRRRLASTVLYYDDWAFAALEQARPVRGGWRYERLSDQRTLLPRAAARALAGGRAVLRARHGLRVEGAGPGRRLAAPAAILEFVEEIPPAGRK